MGKPSIPRGSDYMFNAKWEGNGGGQRVGKFIPYTDNGTITNSCIFNRADTAKLDRTPGSAGSRRIFTLSAWLKFAVAGSGGTGQFFFNSAISTNEQTYIGLDDNYRLNITTNNSSGAAKMHVTTNRTLEDTSKFYHIVVAFDTTQGTDSNKIKVYIDGTQETSFNATDYSGGDNYDLPINVDSANLRLGLLGPNSNYYFDGNMAEVNFIDGTAYGPDTFGITDTSTGRWIPKSLGSITYGTNGFRLQFANSAGQTIGDDTSGNGNDLTVTDLVASDITIDTPSDLFPTLADFQTSYGGTYSEGNLKVTNTTNSQTGTGRSTLTFDVEDSTGYYFEFRNMGTSSFGSNFNGYGITGVNADSIAPSSGALYPNGGHYCTLQEDGTVRISVTGTLQSLGTATLPKTGNTSTRDTIGCAVKSGKVWFSKNGIWGNANQGNPNSDGTPIASGLTGQFRACALVYHGSSTAIQEVNFGQRLSLGGSATSDYSANNGGYFLYPPPSGFRAIKQDNLAETTLGIPDFVWIKDRDNTYNYELYDTTRGIQDRMTAETDVEATITDGLQKFLKGGFQIEDRPGLNTAGSSYISWNWLANGGTTSANTDGSGATTASVIQANQTAGFSVVTYTGTGSQTKIAHGLSSAPEWIMIKNRTVAQAWHVYLKSVGATHAMFLGGSDAKSDSTNYFNDVEPTSSVFTVNSSAGVNQSTKTMLAYCWHSVPGYSAFGSYYTDGNADGPFIYTGFKPKWIMFKSEAAISWYIVDNLRSTINPVTHAVNADSTAVEHTIQINTDFLSNGFKVRATGDYVSSQNSASHDPYHYMAFAEHPFHGNGINPVTAN